MKHRFNLLGKVAMEDNVEVDLEVSEDGSLPEVEVKVGGEVIEGTLEQASAPSVDENTSDGYHTFKELYQHRMVLFSIITNSNKDISWKSRLHHDGTMFDDYFIVGITTPQGDFTYHYSNDYWKIFDVKELERAPEWDKHESDDVIRLYSILPKNEAELVQQEDTTELTEDINQDTID